jgi:hypothetical protein
LSTTNQVFIRGETCMTGWPFPRFHELSQCASIYIQFLGLNPIKCKFDTVCRWSTDQTNNLKNTWVCDLNVWIEPSTFYIIMAKHMHCTLLLEQIKTRRARASWDCSTYLNFKTSRINKLLWGLIEKIETKHA